MIYIVDDDIAQMRPFQYELELRGYSVEYISCADQALIHFTRDPCAELVLLDVMLATNPDKEMSHFSRKETYNYTYTGLVLAEYLLSKAVGMNNNQLVLFSMMKSARGLQMIHRFSAEHKIRFLQKSQFHTTLEFGDEIERILDKKP